MGTLTAVEVKAKRHDPAKGKRPVRFGDGDGLYLQVAAGNTKSWLFRYTLRGKAREMGLGPAGEGKDEVSLSELASAPLPPVANRKPAWNRPSRRRRRGGSACWRFLTAAEAVGKLDDALWPKETER